MKAPIIELAMIYFTRQYALFVKMFLLCLNPCKVRLV